MSPTALDPTQGSPTEQDPEAAEEETQANHESDLKQYITIYGTAHSRSFLADPADKRCPLAARTPPLIFRNLIATVV